MIFFFNGKNEKSEPLCIADGNIKLYSTIQNGVSVPQNIKHIVTMLSRDSSSENIPKRIKSTNSDRYLYTHVVSSVIHIYQKAEINQLSINR